jgi:hypothetical protein
MPLVDLRAVSGEERVDALFGLHARIGACRVQSRGEGDGHRGQRQAGIAGHQACTDRDAATGGITRECNRFRVMTRVEQVPIRGQGILQSCRKGVFRSQPVVEGVGAHAGPHDEIRGKRHGRLW